MTHLLASILSIIGCVRLNNTLLWTLVILALFNSTNDTSQNWGVYHYYVNAKYFDELGYFDLYECTAVVPSTRRDLSNYTFRFDVPDCKSEFSPARYRAFRDDLYQVGFEYRMLRDKGFNATPTWLALAQSLIHSNIVTLDNLAWIDIGMLLIAIPFLIWSVGWRRTAYICLFILTFYGTLDRLWGHFAQWLWLSTALIGVAMLHKGKSSGGFWIGISTSLGVFPIFLMLMYWRNQRAVLWSLLGLILMLFVGLGNSRGVDGYKQFLYNMSLHSSYVRTELCCNIGLAHTITYTANSDSDYLSCFNSTGRCQQDYNPHFPSWAWFILIPFVAVTPLGAMFGLLTLSQYYYLILAVIPIWYGEKWGRRLLLVNSLIIAWMFINPDSAFVYRNGLWILFFFILPLETTYVSQVISPAMAYIQSRLHPKVAQRDVGKQI